MSRRGWFQDGSTVAQVSKRTGINESALRFWAQKGFITKDMSDVDLIEFARHSKCKWKIPYRPIKDKPKKDNLKMDSGLKIIINIPAGITIDFVEA